VGQAKRTLPPVLPTWQLPDLYPGKQCWPMQMDASNLSLVLQAQIIERHVFTSGKVAVIDPNRCQDCGICETVCRFNAVLPPGSSGSSRYRIDPIACDGCAACVYQCPEEAVQMEEQTGGHWFRSASSCGPLFHAELRPAQDNSGKLVTIVKQQARLLALDSEAQMVIVDGPPGTGCPVISAASGADLVLIVAEPTAAGIHDLERVLHLVQHFHLQAVVCINKADLYTGGARQIEAFCQQENIQMMGHVPFDPAVPLAMAAGQPVTAYRPDAPASRAIAGLWARTAEMLT